MTTELAAVIYALIGITALVWAEIERRRIIK